MTPTSRRPCCAADVEHGLHVQRRVDDDRLADVVAADDVRGAAEIAGQDLLEDHRVRSYRAERSR